MRLVHQLLDQRVPRAWRVAFFGLLLVLPVGHVVSRYDSHTQFSALICFGRRFDPRALEQLRAIPRVFAGSEGYDGQFYAQVAIDPTLRHPGLAQALDKPRYRAGRILVPALCHVVGLGRPRLILAAYALINLVFYILLMVGLIRFIRPDSVKQLLCIGAILWTTGCLVSVERALVDLPGSALMFVAASLNGAGALPVSAAALLSRETLLVSLPAVVWPRSYTRAEAGRMLAGACVILLPWLGWVYYVSLMLPPGEAGWGNLGLPFVSLIEHLRASGVSLLAQPTRFRLFEVLAPLSLGVQAAYLLMKPQWGSSCWRMGVGYAVLYAFLSDLVVVEQVAYCRVLLPLTMAFNLLLMRTENRRFVAWFVAGNAGLTWAALRLLGRMI